MAPDLTRQSHWLVALSHRGAHLSLLAISSVEISSLAWKMKKNFLSFSVEAILAQDRGGCEKKPKISVSGYILITQTNLRFTDVHILRCTYCILLTRSTHNSILILKRLSSCIIPPKPISIRHTLAPTSINWFNNLRYVLLVEFYSHFFNNDPRPCHQCYSTPLYFILYRRDHSNQLRVSDFINWAEKKYRQDHQARR